MAKPVIRTAYDGVRVGDDDLFFPADAVGAKQSFKAECDINNIVKSFDPRTGEFSHMSLKAPIFVDTSSMTFAEMMQAMVDARQSFEQLPAAVRAEFDNDPRNFVEYCSDPANWPELEASGLFVKEGVVAAVVAPKEGAPKGGTPVAEPVVESAEPAVGAK